MNSRVPRIVYFVPEFPALTSGVVHSTVLAEAAFVARRGWQCLFVGTETTLEKAAEAEAAISRDYGVEARIYGGGRASGSTLKNLLRFRAVTCWSRPIVAAFRPTHVWTEFFLVVPYARRLAGRNGAALVFDVPAIWCEEKALRSGHGALFRAVRALESRRIARSDHLAGVSHRLADAVERMTGRRDMVVIPCCFDAEAFRFDPQAREQIRAELGFRNGEHVLCYCGGLSEWQRIEDILKVCRELATFEPSMKFLFLTQKTAELVRLAGEVGLDRTRYAALGCLPREVPRYLCAADTGIIMRHDIPVNNVASPIKIGEYLGCGLPVILTPGIGDYSEMLPKAGVGLMLDESGDCARQILDYIRQPEFPALRTKAAEFARAKLSWEAQWPDLQRLFGVEGSQGVEKHV